jgi:hypothetical protein
MAANGRSGASCGLSQVENHVHGLTVCRASCRPGQACYHHHRSKKPVAFADLVEPASLLVVDAIVEELEEGVDYAAKRHPSSRTSAGRDLLSVQLHPHLNLKLSRLSWSTDRQPISFMARSISARRFPSALSTPA